MIKKISRYLENQTLIYIGAITLTLVGIYLRFNYRKLEPLIGDELYAVNILSSAKSFLSFVSQLPYIEFSSYLTGDYYLLYPFVQIFGANKWGIAIPHIISTLFCFYLLFKVCQLHLKNALGFFIAFTIVSFNSTLIEHSFELRYYAIMQTLGLATYYFTYLLAYRPQTVTKFKLIAMGIFFCLAILFHFYSVILICANIAFLLAVHVQDKTFINVAKKILPLFTVVFLITAPILYYVLVLKYHISSIWGNEPFKYIPNPLINPLGFFKGIFCNLIGYKKFYIFLPGLLISLCLPHKDREKQLWFLLILVLLPITVLLLLDLKGGYWFIQRQFIWIMPLFAVLLGWCWESMTQYFSSYAGSRRLSNT